ncbi:MAG: peptide chain release factor N(5)-glutamine methyltransferase [Elusimicrobia bacterium]|nr:peptide chain release factor N(5)-glutamine methyltransferase [Elusimicrobiota bacterium]
MTDDELFLTALLDCQRTELYTRPVTLSPQQQERLDAMRRRRQAGEPVQYICGFTEFMGLRIDVGPGVLIPRPETEGLVERVLLEMGREMRVPRRILDVGTGSGCIAIAMARMLESAHVVGIDVSPDALIFARRNAEKNRVERRVSFVERDVFWYLEEGIEAFDAIISNPPYVPACALAHLPLEVRREPVSALDGGPDGLHFYRYIIPAAWRRISPGGILALEFGDGQEKEIENLFAQTGPWDRIRFEKDLAGRERTVLAWKK